MRACVVSRRHCQDRTIIFTPSLCLRGGDKGVLTYIAAYIRTVHTYCHPEHCGRIILRSVDNTTRPHKVTKPQNKINCFQTLDAAQSLGVCCRRFHDRVVAYIQTCRHSVKLTNLGDLGAGKNIPYGAAPTTWRTDRFPPMWELRDFARCYMTSIVTPFLSAMSTRRAINLLITTTNPTENSMVDEGLSVSLSVLLA